jgi:alpha-galactosidase
VTSAGYNWEEDLLKGYRVRLDGFKVGEANTVKITGTRQDINAPDFDRFGFADC